MKSVGNILFRSSRVRRKRTYPQLCRHTLNVPANRADSLFSLRKLVVIHMDIIKPGHTHNCPHHLIMDSLILPNRLSRLIGQIKYHPLYTPPTRQHMAITLIHK